MQFPAWSCASVSHVSLFSVFGSILVMGMAVLVLVGHIQLTVLSSDTVALKEELEELESQNVILTAQYERMFDLTTVQEAAEAAGMSKPSSSQICYLDISGGDSAVVYQKEEDSVFDRVLGRFEPWRLLSGGIFSVSTALYWHGMIRRGGRRLLLAPHFLERYTKFVGMSILAEKKEVPGWQSPNKEKVMRPAGPIK